MSLKSHSAEVIAILTVFIFLGSFTFKNKEKISSTELYTDSTQNFNFPLPLSSALPFDVDIRTVRQLTAENRIPQATRLFDIFAWQTFLALNWPATRDGIPDAGKGLNNITDPRVYEFWRESRTVFRLDADKPEGWKASQYWNATARAADNHEAPTPQLWMNKIADEAHYVDENLQAFTGPLIDQNGHWVRYEVLMNNTEFDYIYQNGLYNLEGQAAFTAQHPIDFPADLNGTKHGSMEIKLAWKQLDKDDDPSRFFVRKAIVFHEIPTPTGTKTESSIETMGLVGMHIAVRTESSPTWIWATFEQVDNVVVNEMETTKNGQPLHPSFFNLKNPTKPVNTLAPKNAFPDKQGNFTSWAENLTTNPTQAAMILPIPKATAELNSQVQAILRQNKSVFQYYQLIGTQWPVEPGFPAFPGGTSTTGGTSTPESILFKTPGKMIPVYLLNTTMETFFQKGNQVAGPSEEDDRLPAGNLSDSAIIFGTESCVGCHYSAGACIGFKQDENNHYLLDTTGRRIPIFGKDANNGLNGNAHFSWLLQMRAQQKPYSTSKK
jgi:hypothetical protein